MKNSIFKTTILMLLLFISTNGQGQESGGFEITIIQKSYLGSIHEIHLTNNKLIIKELKFTRGKEKTVTICKRKIRKNESLSSILALIKSENFKVLNAHYEKAALDGFNWKYEIRVEDRRQFISVENDSIDLLMELNKEINNLVKKKKGKVLLESYEY